MNNLTVTNSNEPTMPSMELLEVINGYREDEGKAPMGHSDFLKKIRDELEGDAGKFSSVYLGGNNQERPCYNLPKDECMQMAMRESKGVRKATIRKINELVEKPKNLTTLQMISAMALEQQATNEALELAAQRQLELKAQVETTQKHQEAKNVLVEQQLSSIEHKLAQRLPTYERQPSNMTPITVIRKVMNKRYGLSTKIIDTVMYEIKALKPQGTVNNPHVSSGTSVYQVWSKSEVGESFRQFIGECKRESRCRYSHPDIVGTFQLINS